MDDRPAGPTPPRGQVGIQSALGDRARSPLAKYQELVVGSRGLGRLLLYEMVVTFTSWVPGALGLVLRKVAYPLLLGSCGRNVTFGQGVVLRHPAKIHLGDDVVVDDLVVLDAKGSANQGIRLGQGVFLGRGTILSCKDGDIELGDHVNIGFHSEVFSGSRVTVGKYGLFAAYTYLVGGGHEFDRPEVPVIEQARRSVGITLGDNVWLGTGAKVLDGVTVGRDVVVGAGAVVTEDLPDGVVAVGVPARAVRQREPVEPAARS
ncbi:MAG TPA: acyltransferase [Vicinamibacteria bacterium]|nr:acyltransferase [Vicinamibacteria bacterium]